jgi:hypothetical protein
MIRIYYWPEMDQMVIIGTYEQGLTAYASAGKHGWYKSIFPIDLYFHSVFSDLELIYEG